MAWFLALRFRRADTSLWERKQYWEKKRRKNDENEEPRAENGYKDLQRQSASIEDIHDPLWQTRASRSLVKRVKKLVK